MQALTANATEQQVQPAEMEFYIYLNGTKRGPLTPERVNDHLANGLLHLSDLAANTRDGELRALATYSTFGAPPAPEFTAVTPVAPVPRPAVAEPPRPRPSGLTPISREFLGPYARSTLAPNETPFYRTSLHWIVFVRFAFIGLLVVLFLAMPLAIGVQALTGSEIGWLALPLPAFMMVPPTLSYLSSELVVTDMRVLIKSGIIRRQTLEMFVSKVESISVDQGFLGRVFDYGTVLIRGTGGSQEPFEAIAHPLEFRNCVQRLQSADREIASA